MSIRRCMGNMVIVSVIRGKRNFEYTNYIYYCQSLINMFSLSQSHDRFRNLRWTVLELDAFLGFNPSSIRMLDGFHLGDQVGEFNQLGGGMAAGDHDV